MTFWKTATKEQKLSQIDGGIECGMSARQIGLNLGTSRDNVIAFANGNGRSFPRTSIRPAQSVKAMAHAMKRKLVDDNTKMPEAFDIFGAKESKWEMEL
jgi:hypothetical protein